MKLKYYIIATLAAAAALFTGCKEEGDTYFNEIRVSQSYVGIPMEGGAMEITVSAQGEWAFDEESIPEWLTVNPKTGGAGETKVSLSAEKTLDGRNAELLLACLGRVQHINIIQGLAQVSEATVKQVMEGPEKKYRVTGVVTKIHGAHYGNMYLNDGTVEDPGLQIYGTLDKKGNKMSGSTPYDCFGSHENAWDIAVGDKVTVEGPMSIYKNEAELVDVTIIKIEKALVKVIPMEIELEGPEAGDTLIKIATKAPSIKVKPNVDWLYVKEMEQKDDTVYTRVGYFANDDVVKREGTISVTGEGFNDITITFTQGANAPDLMTIAQALQGSYVHVKGTIMAICARGYVISDATGSLLAYYGSAFDASKYAIGDEVEIISDISAYNYGPQLSCDGKPNGFDLEVLTKGPGTVAYPTPKVMDTEACDAILAAINGKDGRTLSDVIKMEYVQIVATPKKSGNYTNIFLDDYTAADFSAYQLPASFDLASMLDKKVTIRGYTQSVSGGKHINIVFTELLEGEEDVPTIEYTDLSTINALADNSEFTLTCVTAAVGKNGVVVTDGTTGFYVFKPNTTPEVGDIVTVTGTKTTYYKLIESSQGAAVTVVQTGATVPELVATDVTATFDAYPDDTHGAEFISFTGTYSTSGSNVNVAVEGATSRTGSLQGSLLDSKWDNKKVKVSGFYIGTSGSGGKYFNLVATKIEEVE